MAGTEPCWYGINATCEAACCHPPLLCSLQRAIKATRAWFTRCCNRCLQPGAELNQKLHERTRRRSSALHAKEYESLTGPQSLKMKEKEEDEDDHRPSCFTVPPVVVRVAWKWLFLCYGAVRTIPPRPAAALCTMALLHSPLISLLPPYLYIASLDRLSLQALS